MAAKSLKRLLIYTCHLVIIFFYGVSVLHSRSSFLNISIPQLCNQAPHARDNIEPLPSVCTYSDILEIHDFDIVSQWIEHEGRVIARRILWPWPWPTMIFTAGFDPCLVKRLNFRPA